MGGWRLIHLMSLERVVHKTLLTSRDSLRHGVTGLLLLLLPLLEEPSAQQVIAPHLLRRLVKAL